MKSTLLCISERNVLKTRSFRRDLGGGQALYSTDRLDEVCCTGRALFWAGGGYMVSSINRFPVDEL